MMGQSNRRLHLREYFKASISEDVLLEAEMLALTFATGIEDAVTFSDFHCFVSNQTGNTILLAIAVTRKSLNIVSISNVATSLLTFILGAWAMGQVGNFVGCRMRGWLILSSIIQTLLVFAASGLQFYAGTETTGPGALGFISLQAVAAGGQIAMARSLHMTEITTANATSVYVDTLIDVNLYKFHNRPRNRRLLFLMCLCGGSAMGAFAYMKFGSAPTLLISAVGKAFVTIALFFNVEMSNKQESLDLTPRSSEFYIV